MIHLHLAIGEGDSQEIKFFTGTDLADYLQELKPFDCIWLATPEGEKGEILITESVDLLCESVRNGFFNLLWNSPQHFFVQEYQSFESAYAVALDMREGHEKHFDK